MADNHYQPDGFEFDADNDAMWRAPSDTDIYEMTSLEGAPYIPTGENNPYAPQAAQNAGAQAAHAQNIPAATQNQGNPYAQGQTQVPATQYNAASNPVPSPPQQAPYIPGSAIGSTQQAPAVTPRQAKRNARAGAPSSPDANNQQAAWQNNEHPRARATRAPREHKPAKHGFLSFFLWLIIIATYAFLSLRLIPADYANGRLIPELASFIPLALIPAALCFVLALLWHRRVLIVVSFIALAVNAYWHAGYFIPTAKVSAQAETAVLTSADTEDSYARIMTVNTLNGYASSADIVRICREQNVEVLCLQEMTDGMISDLENAGIYEVLPYSLISAGASSISNGGRNAIYTKAPMSNTDRNLLPIDTSSMPAADIEIGGQTVRFVSVHPNSPVRGAQDLWDEGLSIIGSLANYNHSYVVMGDFNSTWDHARFRELLGTSFVDASEQSGEGFHMTYPSDGASISVGEHEITFPCPSLIEIDHIVYSKNSGIVISSLETVSIGGTDHKGLLATLEVSSS